MPDGKYHPSFRFVVWKMVSKHVGIDNVNDVIDDCLSLVGKKLARRPARSTLMDMSVARLSAAQQQLQVMNKFYCLTNDQQESC